MTARKLGGVWFVDFYFTHITGTRAGARERIRKRSPVDTKRGAEEYERLLRERLLQGKPLDPSEEAKVVPTCAVFFAEWLDTYALTNNKPSSAEAKRSIGRA